MDNDLRLELMFKIKDTVECLTLLINEIGNLTVGLMEAGDRMAIGLGQKPDEDPLPPVADFLAAVGVAVQGIKTINETLQVVTRNQVAMAESLRLPLVQ